MEMERQPNHHAPGQQASRVPKGGGGVAGIWYRDGQVLMTRRAQGIPFEGQWCFPGGGMEAGEDEIAALNREWQEELGTSIRAARRMGSVEITGSNGRFPLHWYFVQPDERTFKPNPAEVAEVRWIPVEQVLSMPDVLPTNHRMLTSLGPDLRTACDAACQALAVHGDRRLPAWQRDLRQHLDDLRARGMHRQLRTVASPVGRTIRLETGREALNFASNDYLGLAADPRLAEASRQALGQWGWGAGGSRLICGHTSAHAELERALAAFKNTEAAIVLPTGYMANLAAIRVLAARGDVILLDKLDHASILDAAGACGAEVRVFPHGNYTKLEQLLGRYGKARRRIIVTDTVFSMDGDVADLPRLVQLKNQYGAVLVVDEAHATGVLGSAGRGLAELQGVENDVDVCVGTLSKALGGLGGFVTGPAVLIEAMINLARPFLFTTGLPAAACAAATRALEIVRAEPWRRQKVLELAGRLRELLAAAGWDTAGSQTQIVPLVVRSAERAVRLAEDLLPKGFFVPAIRPPAVPPGGSRLRISVTAAHEPRDIADLARALSDR
jgi:8-amino-7-oxononanoate synthase